MPSLEKHIELSKRRTGKEFQKVHEWLDGRQLSIAERIERHKITNIQKFLPVIEKKFGKDGVAEYLRHIADDYDKDLLLLLFKKAEKLKFWKPI